MSANGSSHTTVDPLDTEYIVRDYFHEQLKRKGYLWSTNRVVTVNCAANGSPNNRNVNLRLNANKRSKICESLCSLSNDLLSSFGPNIVEMCERLSLPSPSSSDSTINWSSIGYQSFKGVANELFCEGIKWGHILTLFVFSSELAFHSGVSKGHPSVVDDIALWLCLYLNDNILQWISDHGGWETFILYANGADEIDSAFVRSRRNWSLGKFLFVGGSLGLLGAITAAGLLFITKKFS
ncbi:apoptosis regulator Bcl-2-like protein [Dinothrombium tinctorium]|uniref:Apoptosis regulator Bcl-2-like protein n=1 Tax=Dinothrombium tinctorium TaxID=1965070 RepID=A0A443R7H7_9ACAR|nr:apoptosis regulator Bcl-2-like protein [Dinothrombium tinctorium]